MSFSAKQERINEIRRDLHANREAQRELVAGGQNISVAGGVTIGRASLDDLRRQEADLIGQLAALEGRRRVTRPDFS